MDAAAKVTSKGQITVPKVVRDALGIDVGDEVVFRVEGDRPSTLPTHRIRSARLKFVDHRLGVERWRSTIRST
jgi:AbrB family looped-hinge helix DNA binding protein